MKRLSRALRRILPRSLLGRSLLIILVPLVIVQAVALQVFYGSHLDVFSRRLAAAVAGDIGFALDTMDRWPGPDGFVFIARRSIIRYEIGLRFEPGATLPPGRRKDAFGPIDDDFAAALEERVGRPFTFDWNADPQTVAVQIEVPGGVVVASVPRKRLYSGTVVLFVLWLVGTALLVFVLAAIFMRQQVRAIRRLSAAAEAFGMGRDPGPIKPEGGSEVRQAAVAFNRMQERVRRFLAQRTEMLAGVSHDLRTPLTRMRLALAMMPASEEAAEIATDVDEMERMVDGYLAFARGEGAEQARPTDLAGLLEEVVAAARRGGADIALDAADAPTLPLRPDAMRRAIGNLVDNARRHGRRVRLAVRDLRRGGHGSVQVTIDDDGPGMPADQREEAFRAFSSGAGSTGLGLTIARDILRAHGGDIVLEDSPLGGLRARIRLPH